MAETRGSWNVAAGVLRRWQEKNLDAVFREHWPAGAGTDCLPFNDTEARPLTPMPYCIYEQGEEFVVSRMSGKTPSTENVLANVPLKFTVHAGSKPLARDLILKIAEAFDKKRLNILPDRAVLMKRMTDFSARMADREWAWALQYTLQIDAENDIVSAD